MKTVYPDYYPRFRCLAGACRHTCCAGWEIDIDARTLEKYQSMPGELGERLRQSIVREGDAAHFRLEAEERCPFLNGAGLCDVILQKGEKALCQICADHPRFYNRLRGYKEIGLGLCCEAACRLILSQKEPVRLLEADDGRGSPPRGRDAGALRFRGALLALAQDRSRAVASRMRAIGETLGLRLPPLSPAQWADVYLQLERMDGAWTGRLLRLREANAFPALDEVMLEQLLVCLLYRHVLPHCRAGRGGCAAMFAVLSAQMIAWVSHDDADLYEAARLYSAEIEYSDENVPALIDLIAAAQEEETHETDLLECERPARRDGQGL